MPVIFNEPLSFIQRLCEYMEYSSLLTQACHAHNSTKRMEVSYDVIAAASQVKKKKSNLQYTRFAPGQYSSEETSQRWRIAGDRAFDLTGPGIKPSTSRANSNALHNYPAEQFVSIISKNFVGWITPCRGCARGSHRAGGAHVDHTVQGVRTWITPCRGCARGSHRAGGAHVDHTVQGVRT